MPSCASSAPSCRALLAAAIADPAARASAAPAPPDRGSARRGRRRDRWRRRCRRPDQRVGDRPHDDLALADDPIDRDADAPRAAADDEHVQRDRAARRRCRTAAPSRTIGSAAAAVRHRSRCCSTCTQRRAGRPRCTSRTDALRHGERLGRRRVAISASVIASVSGSSMTNRVPAPGVGLERSVPRQLLDRRLARRAMPTPRPLARSDSSRVEKPGAQSSVEQRRARRAARRGTGSPAAARARDHRRRVDAAPIVGDLDARRCRRRSRRDSVIVPSGPLAGGDALVRRSRCRG